MFRLDATALLNCINMIKLRQIVGIKHSACVKSQGEQMLLQYRFSRSHAIGSLFHSLGCCNLKNLIILSFVLGTSKTLSLDDHNICSFSYQLKVKQTDFSPAVGAGCMYVPYSPVLPDINDKVRNTSIFNITSSLKLLQKNLTNSL